MDALLFAGRVATGIGCHSNLVVPGGGALKQGANGWPLLLHPGSLNIRVDVFPPQLGEHGLPDEVSALDSGLFAPAFEILRDEFGNNKLRASRDNARRGDAQVWRAKIDTQGHEIADCWVLRRFGSRVGNQLEFVANRRLRDEGLSDDQPVSAVLFGHWCKG